MLEPDGADGISRIARLAQQFASAAPNGPSSVADRSLDDQRTQIDELIDVGKRLAQRRDAVAGVIVEAAWGTDLTTTRRDSLLTAVLGSGS